MKTKTKIITCYFAIVFLFSICLISNMQIENSAKNESKIENPKSSAWEYFSSDKLIEDEPIEYGTHKATISGIDTMIITKEYNSDNTFYCGTLTTNEILANFQGHKNVWKLKTDNGYFRYWTSSANLTHMSFFYQYDSDGTCRITSYDSNFLECFLARRLNNTFQIWNRTLGGYSNIDTLKPNNWYHIGIMVDIPNKTVSYYINGTLKGNAIFVNANAISSTITRTYFNLESDTCNHYFDSILYSNKPLTEIRIFDNYNQQNTNSTGLYNTNKELANFVDFQTSFQQEQISTFEIEFPNKQNDNYFSFSDKSFNFNQTTDYINLNLVPVRLDTINKALGSYSSNFKDMEISGLKYSQVIATDEIFNGISSVKNTIKLYNVSSDFTNPNYLFGNDMVLFQDNSQQQIVVNLHCNKTIEIKSLTMHKFVQINSKFAGYTYTLEQVKDYPYSDISSFIIIESFKVFESNDSFNSVYTKDWQEISYITNQNLYRFIFGYAKNELNREYNGTYNYINPIKAISITGLDLYYTQNTRYNYSYNAYNPFLANWNRVIKSNVWVYPPPPPIPDLEETEPDLPNWLYKAYKIENFDTVPISFSQNYNTINETTNETIVNTFTYTYDFNRLHVVGLNKKFFYNPLTLNPEDFGNWPGFNWLKYFLVWAINMLSLLTQFLNYLLLLIVNSMFLLVMYFIIVLIWNYPIYYLLFALIGIVFYILYGLFWVYQGISSIIQWLWVGIKWVFNWLYEAILWLWNEIILPIFEWIWNNVVIPIWNWLYEFIFQPIGQWFVDTYNWLITEGFWIIFDWIFVVISHIIAILLYILSFGLVPYSDIQQSVYLMMKGIHTTIFEFVGVFISNFILMIGYSATYVLLVGLIYVKYIYARSRGFLNRANKLESMLKVYIIPISIGINLVSKLIAFISLKPKSEESNGGSK